MKFLEEPVNEQSIEPTVGSTVGATGGSYDEGNGNVIRIGPIIVIKIGQKDDQNRAKG